MKNFAIVLLMLWGFYGCNNRNAKLTGKSKILVTILPEKGFIEKIAGDEFDITVLVPPGANPATYSLSPSQMVDIVKADIWFKMGYTGFELSWSNRIQEAHPEMKMVDLSEGLDLITHRSEGNSTFVSGVDPHTWLSPQRVKKMALLILNNLILLNPAKAESYSSGYQRFLDEIDSTDETVIQILNTCRGKKFVTFHPSLSYFAKDYGLIQLSMEEGGKEPTPAHLAFLAKTARQEGIRSVFIQSDFDKEFARTFANEFNGKIIQVWPLNPDWSNNLVSIARLLSEN
jgi:zinc transport system substrate-binding protein